MRNADQTFTVDQLVLPRRMRFLNWAGDRFSRPKRPFLGFSAASLRRMASRLTGLSDWGNEAFHERLVRLVRSFQEEADLTTAGRLIVRSQLTRALCNRLLIQDALTRHPEILEERIRRPLYVVGFPRTGTTLLYNLLAQDPGARPPLLWELLFPVPLPKRMLLGNRRFWGPEPRIKLTDFGLRRMHRTHPWLRSIHPLDTHAPEECLHLLQNTFAYTSFHLFGQLPAYLEWLLQYDMVPVYEEYRRQLQLLQWQRRSDHWLLKSPLHLAFLDALLGVFPDACIVQTHRDPCEVIASACSLMTATRSLSTRHVDPHAIGEEVLSLLAVAINRGMAARDAADPALFYDVYYTDLTADPEGVVRQIYEHFGFERPAPMDANVQRWLQEHPRHKHGVHRYTLEQFGLSEERVRLTFSAYLDRFFPRA